MNFGLQPSMEVFRSMLHELAIGRENRDGADQGFLASYFPDLLDQPMFHQPPNATKLDGNYRLPLGYQMDASYYCEYISHLFQGFFFFFLIILILLLFSYHISIHVQSLVLQILNLDGPYLVDQTV